MRLVFDDITLALPDFTLRANLEVETNALGIFGPSGAGKTTLLEVVAGLRSPDRGRIFVNDVEITSMKTRDRRIAYVPQDDTLFPHMSVKRNVLYGLQSRTEGRQAGAPVLHWIDDVIGRSVAKLSGGERRRVALARAIAMEPRLLLLDELFSGLDDERKRQIIDVLPQPIVFVSHVREEIAAVCEHVVSIERGQCSTPASLPQSSLSRSSRPQLKR